jgi:hypothetical protein
LSTKIITNIYFLLLLNSNYANTNWYRFFDLLPLLRMFTPHPQGGRVEGDVKLFAAFVLVG